MKDELGKGPRYAGERRDTNQIFHRTGETHTYIRIYAVAGRITVTIPAGLSRRSRGDSVSESKPTHWRKVADRKDRHTKKMTDTFNTQRHITQ